MVYLSEMVQAGGIPLPVETMVISGCMKMKGSMYPKEFMHHLIISVDSRKEVPIKLLKKNHSLTQANLFASGLMHAAVRYAYNEQILIRRPPEARDASSGSLAVCLQSQQISTSCPDQVFSFAWQ